MNVVAFIGLTLDGVMQAPGPPEEDRRGGFEHGGWMLPYADAVRMRQYQSIDGRDRGHAVRTPDV